MMLPYFIRSRYVRTALTVAVTGTVCSMLLTGCGSNSKAPSSSSAAEEQHAAEHEHGHIQYASNGDLQETTESIGVLPSFLSGLTNQIALAYKTAAAVHDTLEWIPCYCGCGGSAGHLNNLNCFIKEIHEDGSVVWDDHGTKCDVCMETAFQTALMLQEGKSVKEIRTFIDDTYKTGYAKPTPTPMPA
ncbi:PCYCGC domain-containing protein [Paenibacillus kobensis]|uniref:PCYCGC domain-containing protein n=1 Tax=Paenibacillus kobensis TaxID=59841 RepID=UPI001FEA6A04|nr:PCYCGC domain-containing protein [Paenibacillus kobensis]